MLEAETLFTTFTLTPGAVTCLKPYYWAVRFEAKARELMMKGDHESLIHYERLGKDAPLLIPTPDHYLPLLYAIATRRGDEPITFPVEGVDGGIDIDADCSNRIVAPGKSGLFDGLIEFYRITQKVIECGQHLSSGVRISGQWPSRGLLSRIRVSCWPAVTTTGELAFNAP